MATRRRELITLGTRKEQRTLPSQSGFFGSDARPEAGSSKGQVSSMYDGCPTDLVEFADEPSMKANEVTLTPEDELEELTKRGLGIMGDPVTRDMLHEADRQIITRKGDVIGKALVEKLHRSHARIQDKAYHMREFHFAPDQPLVSRYQQELRNETLLKRQLRSESDLEGIGNEFFDNISGDSPTELATETAVEFGPKISFKDPAQGRTAREAWLGAEEVWEAKRRETFKKGSKPVEIWGVQRAPKGQLQALNAQWERLNDYGPNKAELDVLRDQYNSVKKQLHGVNDPRRRAQLQEQAEEIATKGRRIAKNIDSYHNRGSVKPGDYDAPNGVWSLDDMQQRAFKSKAEAEGWINANTAAHPEAVFKPYRRELQRVDKDKGKKKVKEERSSLASLRHQRQLVVEAGKQKKVPWKPGEKGTLQGVYKSLTTRIKNLEQKIREEAGTTGKEYLQLAWNGNRKVFPAANIDKARAFASHVQKIFGVKPQAAWMDRHTAIGVMDELAQQTSGVGATAKKPRSMIALSVDGNVSYYEATLLPTLKRAATTLRHTGKKNVKLSHVKTDAPATTPMFAVRARELIETSGGEQVPFTLPITADRQAHYERLFAEIDREAPTIVSGPSLETRAQGPSSPSSKTELSSWAQDYVTRRGLGV